MVPGFAQTMRVIEHVRVGRRGPPKSGREAVRFLHFPLHERIPEMKITSSEDVSSGRVCRYVEMFFNAFSSINMSILLLPCFADLIYCYCRLVFCRDRRSSQDEQMLPTKKQRKHTEQTGSFEEFQH